MLSAVVFAPALAGLVLVLVPARAPRGVFVGTWIAVSGADLVAVIVAWARWPGEGSGPAYAYEEYLPWIPGLGVGYHVGVDGLSAPLVALTAGLFLAVAVYSLRETRRVKPYVLLFLGLQTVCLGVFVALDLILFFLFFDLSIVGMYFLIAGWGHGRPARAALLFFLYTFVGSLVMLLGFLGLAVAVRPVSFDIPTLLAADPLAGRGLAGGLVLLAVGIGLAIKTPTVPFHTWLPPAHTDAPAAGSAILAGVLLKMGTYGFVRIAMPLLPEAWRRWALVLVVVGVVSVLYGALVALAQRDVKRLIAYTSINHMGYVVLAVGAAGVVSAGEQARAVAVSGAVTQMVSHGLITGALFLLAGILWDRGGSYDLDAWSGLAGPMPRFATVLAVAAFASLGLPGLSGFVAEFQVLAGSLPARPVATVAAATGIAVTAALFLRALQRLLLGEPRVPTGGPRRPRELHDLRPAEISAVVPLLVASVVVGLAPAVLLTVVEPGAWTLVELVTR